MSMNGADVQVEKGNFTRIHNAILEQLVRTVFSAREYAVVLYLLRMTYGYQTTTVKHSGAQWEQGTGIKRQNVMAAVANLVKRNIIIQEGGGRGRGNVATYKFNKYFETWDRPKNESRGMHFTGKEMNPGECILGPENESPSMQENESPSMQCTSGLKKVKKAAVKKEPAAAFSKAPFIAAYERIWGLLVPSEYVAQEIAEWETRITLEAWCYGLQECADARKIGQMKYLRSILRRVEQEGLATAPAQPSSTLDFAMEQIQ